MFRAPYSFEGQRLIAVDIEQLVPSQDGLGAPSTDWTTFAKNVPMALENLDGDERMGDHAQIEALDHWEVLCRYMKLPASPEKMRLNFARDNTTYLLDITSVKNPGMQNRWLIFRAKSGVNRG